MIILSRWFKKAMLKYSLIFNIKNPPLKSNSDMFFRLEKINRKLKANKKTCFRKSLSVYSFSLSFFSFFFTASSLFLTFIFSSPILFSTFFNSSIES